MADKVDENFFFVFLNLYADKMAKPDYLIASGEETKPKVKEYGTRGIIDLSSINNDDFKTDGIISSSSFFFNETNRKSTFCGVLKCFQTNC